MSKRKYLAVLRWLSINENGKRFIPTSNFYTPILRIQKDIADNADWSVQIETIGSINQYVKKVHINFTITNAPSVLAKGVYFSLLEGNKVVATGEIIGII